ncbi:HlyD family efflux transporter periplasmic adaptor subunit [Scytonema sp. NUACC26]|uniref:HlyD family efflux transporter periplasmic adaptor subunit n=1 Tax=Scytonema sp. NUACC26 TaxID=3140176 RepID=UPI0034DC2D85
MLETPTPEQLPTIQGNEFLPQISPWAIVAGISVITILGSAVALSTILKYSVAVKVLATIRPAGDLRLVQAAVEGTITKILVSENQQVKKGEAIAYIDNSRLQTQKSQIQSSIQQSELQIQQIDAQLKSLESQIAAKTNLIDRNIAASKAELAGVQRNYQDQQVKAQADKNQAETNLQLARVQLERLQTEQVLSVTVQEAEAALQLAKTQFDRLQSVSSSGAISRTLLEEKEQAVKAARAKLEQAKISAKNLLEEKQQALKVAQLNLQRAETALNPSDASVTVAMENISQASAKGKATLASLNKERQTLLQQRLEQQKQRDRTQKQLQQINSDIYGTILRAPIAGTILQLNLRNPQQVVRPGEAIASIAPQNAALVIKTQVSSNDIDKVKPGQDVQIQVSACPYPDYGTLKGTVKTVAPDALIQPGINTAAYEVSIQPQQMYVGELKNQCQLLPGMEGKADIISRQETVLKFVLRKMRLISNI